MNEKCLIKTSSKDHIVLFSIIPFLLSIIATIFLLSINSGQLCSTEYIRFNISICFFILSLLHYAVLLFFIFKTHNIKIYKKFINTIAFSLSLSMLCVLYYSKYYQQISYRGKMGYTINSIGLTCSIIYFSLLIVSVMVFYGFYCRKRLKDNIQRLQKYVVHSSIIDANYLLSHNPEVNNFFSYFITFKKLSTINIAIARIASLSNPLATKDKMISKYYLICEVWNPTSCRLGMTAKLNKTKKYIYDYTNTFLHSKTKTEIIQLLSTNDVSSDVLRKALRIISVGIENEFLFKHKQFYET